MFKNKRKCVIPNYIPHKQPRKLNYNKWCENYYINLIDLYDIFIENLKERYENIDIDENIDININFDDFCKLIYFSSSKFII
jgi:hypothetical protein